MRNLHEKQYQNVLNVCAQFPQLDAEVTLEGMSIFCMNPWSERINFIISLIFHQLC